jgi:FixJ family two-component response regulator
MLQSALSFDPHSAVSKAPHCVFVVDDDPSVRESLEMLLEEAGWRVRAFASGREYLAASEFRGPACLLLDMGLPDVSGLELQRFVARDRPSTPIVFISGCADVTTAVRAMKGGALDVLPKPLHDETLLGAVDHAMQWSAAVRQREEEVAALKVRHASLTRREREVMALVVAGRLNKQVGADLGISEITVKAHRGNVMRKMRLRSLPDLVRAAALLGPAASPC